MVPTWTNSSLFKVKKVSQDLVRQTYGLAAIGEQILTQGQLRWPLLTPNLIWQSLAHWTFWSAHQDEQLWRFTKDSDGGADSHKPVAVSFVSYLTPFVLIENAYYWCAARLYLSVPMRIFLITQASHCEILQNNAWFAKNWWGSDRLDYNIFIHQSSTK